MWMSILLIAGVAFIGYALWTQYSKTPAEESIPKRVLASLVAAAGMIGAGISAWLHSGAPTP